MERLKRVFLPAALFGLDAGALRDCVLITDSNPLAGWALERRLVVIRTDGTHLGDAATLDAIVGRLGARGATTIVCGVGFDRDVGTQEFAEIARHAEGAFAMVHRLIETKRELTLIGVRRSEAAAASVLDGIGFSARHETTRLRYAALAVDGALDAGLAAALAAVRATPGRRYWFDGNALQREALLPLDAAATAETGAGLRRHGRYVIAGGGGGIGGLLSAWLARRYQATVCVIGRSDLDETRKARLKASGVKSYVQADVTDFDALSAAMQHITTRHGAIDGVFQLAGILDDRLIVNKDGADVTRVLAPKIAGALNLWRLDQSLAPRFVCHFTSLSGLVGNVGQANYAAANAFVDALTEHLARDAAPPRWSAINWGLWASGGMQPPAGENDLVPMVADDACEALAQIIDARTPLSAVFAGRRSLLGELADAGQLSLAAAPATTAVSLTPALVDWIGEVVYKFSRLRDVAADASLVALGIDSAALISIVSAIERRLAANGAAITLNKAIIFDYPSIAALAHYLVERHPQATVAAFNDGTSPVLPHRHGPPLAGSAPARAADIEAHVIPATPAAAAPPVPPAAPPAQQPQAASSQACRPDDIAIIGLAGEFPGADSIEELWTLLAADRDAITVIPAERWSWQRDYSLDQKRLAGSYGRHGGFLRRAKAFDPAFFGITPVEAIKIDPQERRLLAMAYHALEDAGHFAAPTEDTGVFAAAMFGHYQNLDAETGPISSSFSSIANRISYFFNFQGPSFCVDSMCSGSLSALHLAIASLRQGECRRALVGAVNVMPHPGKLRLLSAGRFLSATGRCHSFGIEADGYAPGEGAVVVVLKPLRDALANEDRIHGIIRGSALNSGGRSSGFTVPSARAQERVIRQALSRAGVNAADIDYVEAHGTGTSLGDPIEISALAAAYGRRDGAERLVGSIKSNIGHLESAAGLAGLAKVLLQFHHRTIAATRNCEIENLHLDLAASGFRLPRRAEPWAAPGGTRLAGLSSFGAGGSNAHVIVQDHAPTPPALPVLDHYLVALSGRTPRALAARIEALAQWLDGADGVSLYAVAYTLGVCREHFRHRACFAVRDAADLKRQLAGFDPAAPTAIPAGLGAAERALIERYRAGDAVAFASLYRIKALVSLPHYVFDEQEYWDPAIAPPREAAATPRTDADDSFVTFAPAWRPAPLASQPARTEERRPCLVICGAREARGLAMLPGIVTIVPGASFTPGERRTDVRADSIVDCVAALRRHAPADGVKPWLINLADSTCDDESPVPARFQFTLAKAMAATGATYRMAFVHGDGNGRRTAPLAGALAATFRVLAMEEADFELVSLEVDDAALEDPAALVALAREELDAAPGTFLACRRAGNERSLAELREVTLPAPSAGRFRQGGVYLITGGLGMIGIAVAKKLVTTFGATVVLVGRTAPGEATGSKLEPLRHFGGRVEYMSADVTDAAAATALVASIVKRHGALHGVIHSAAVLKDGLVRNKSAADFDSVLAVKVDAARNLDRATAEVALDFFVLFSSISGLFGNVGQADYAAGNRYLDLFARARRREVTSGRRHGLTLSIDWPLWIDDGSVDLMREYRSLGGYLRDNYGMDMLALERGAALLVRLIDSAGDATPQIAPFVGDLDTIRTSMSRGMLHTARAATAAPSRLAAILRSLVVELTGLADDDIGDRTSFGDLGLSSVKLQQLAARIEERCAIPIPPSAFFSHNTLEALAAHLSARGARVDDRAAAAPPTASAAPVVSPAAVAASPAPAAPAVVAPAAAAPEPKPGVAAADRRVAIIGIDGRLPGGVDLAGFWEGLIANRSAIKPVERWSHAAHFAGTIPHIEQFDARFFGLSPREAMLMDPQHRLFLQASYNAMLDAGYAPRSLARVAVFAGVQFSDYQTLLQMSGRGNHPYAATGNAHAMLANRVSYLFDCDGPSQTIDTACSSALVAVNRAVLSLNAGECDHAIVGAVSLLLDSAMTDAARSMGVLSPNHRCATFDADADGYVRAEGVGCLLLKRYADAERDGDSIYAVIEATAENHGGRANSLTAPNPAAQQRLLLAAYSPELARRVSYIETHGTGTKLGDPVEIDALKGAWRTLVPDAASPVLLGSVKSAIGHLEPAAGIASMLKVILALKHGVLPANLNFTRLNPYIDLGGSPFRVVAENTAWDGEERVAGISSFGFGGANAHVVLADPPKRAATAPRRTRTHLVALSAKTPRSLMDMKDALLRHLVAADGKDLRLADIATTLGEGRDHCEHRLAWVAGDVAGLVEALRATDAGGIRHVGKNGAAREGVAASPGGDDDATTARTLYLGGGEPDWARLLGDDRGRRIHLPAYAFDTRPFWFDDAPQTAPTADTQPSAPAKPAESSIAQANSEAGVHAQGRPAAVASATNPGPTRTGDSGGRRAPERIVLVGAAARFPGSESLQGYWQSLLDGRNCASAADRWQTPDTAAMSGGFLDGIAEFDAAFFRISPNEARCMDPQHRVLMEVAHHAIEDCGLPLATLRQMRCGVFCTSLPGDYKFVLAQDPERAFSSHSFAGNAASSLSGRISYFYDFNGPSITIDTACSSSLTALEIACREIESGACDAALVGAVSIFSTSELFEFARRTNMLSAQGRCATFGEAADGFVPSEGAAAIMLMTESRAAALGLDVLVTIEAIGLNHDGQSNGLMAPNGRAQAELIEDVYRRADLPVSSVGYVEAHGTGTKLGDPIELAALSRAYRGRDASYRAYLGASKSVIGHTLVCSGLASVLKTMLVLRHRTIPAHPVAGPISGELDLDRFVVNTETVAWPADKAFAAVSAFGFTGSNAHVVLGRAPARATQPFRRQGAYPFILSAQTAASLQAKLAELRSLVGTLPDEMLGSLSIALGKGTETHRLRVAVVAATRQELAAALDDLLARPAPTLGTAASNVRGIADATLAARVTRWLAGEDVRLYDEVAVASVPRIDVPKYAFDRKQYWAGELPAATRGSGPAVPAAASAEILGRLKANIADLLGFDERDIDVARPVRDYGIDSISIIKLLAQFGAAAAELQPQDIFNYPSLEAFAADLTRRGAPDGAAAPAVQSGARQKLLQWRRAAAQGRPAVLLPPLNMSDEAWTQQIAALRRHGFAPHIPIYPGHLDNALGGRALEPEALVDEIADYIRTELGGTRVPLLGWSLGGCFSLAVAAKAPQLVSALVLISTAARFDGDIFGKTIDLHRELEANADYLDVVLKPGRNVVEQVGAGATMDVLKLYYRMLAEFDMVDALPRIKVPTLIVHGRRDVVIDDADVALLRSIPNAAAVEFEDQGHFIPLTAARRFNERALQFLAEEVAQ